MSGAIVLSQVGGPWIFRSGRPFGQAGDAVSVAVPWPTTVAGAVRTAWGDRASVDFAETVSREALMARPVRGPLVARLGPDQTVEAVLLPRPADALYLEEERADAVVARLSPGALEAGCGTDLPQGLMPVYLRRTSKSKPVDGPAWWTVERMQDWLLGHAFGKVPEGLGWTGPVLAHRTHVCIDRATQVAEEGMLFQTQGAAYEQWSVEEDAPFGRRPQAQFGLVAQVGEPVEGMVRLGADGGMAWARWVKDAWPAIPQALEQELAQARRIRLVLVTPGLFEHGWRPGWLAQVGDHWEGTPPGLEGPRRRLRAAVLGRWMPVSGWDLVQRKPRAVRRAVPPGAVYWFEVVAGGEHTPRLWLESIADPEQARRDGFGLVVPGLWTEGE